MGLLDDFEALAEQADRHPNIGAGRVQRRARIGRTYFPRNRQTGLKILCRCQQTKRRVDVSLAGKGK